MRSAYFTLAPRIGRWDWNSSKELTSRACESVVSRVEKKKSPTALIVALIFLRVRRVQLAWWPPAIRTGGNGVRPRRNTQPQAVSFVQGRRGVPRHTLPAAASALVHIAAKKRRRTSGLSKSFPLIRPSNPALGATTANQRSKYSSRFHRLRGTPRGGRGDRPGCLARRGREEDRWVYSESPQGKGPCSVRPRIESG